MNANAFRHFTENRKIWDGYIRPLSHEQFTQHVDYSHGSVRDQIMNLMSADETWFSDLRCLEVPEVLNPADINDRKTICRGGDKDLNADN